MPCFTARNTARQGVSTKPFSVPCCSGTARPQNGVVRRVVLQGKKCPFKKKLSKFFGTLNPYLLCTHGWFLLKFCKVALDAFVLEVVRSTMVGWSESPLGAYVWIGLYSSETEDGQWHWKWYDGSPVNYTNWWTSDRLWGSYAEMAVSDGQWHQRRSHHTLPADGFVCQKECSNNSP